MDFMHPKRYGYVINKLFYDYETERREEKKKTNFFCMQCANNTVNVNERNDLPMKM